MTLAITLLVVAAVAFCVALRMAHLLWEEPTDKIVPILLAFTLLGSTTVSAQGLSPEDEIKFDQALVKLDKARNRLLNIREKLFGVEQTLSDQGIVAENASGRVGDISTTNLDWKKRNDVAGALSTFLAPFLGLLGVSGVGAGAIFAVRSRAKKRAASAVDGRSTVHLAVPRRWKSSA